MFGHQRGQDADHHDVGPARAGLGLGVIEAGPYFGFQIQTGMPGQWPGRNIEFDVVGAQFGLVSRIRDRGQDVSVQHGGLIVGVDEVAFDFHAGKRVVGIEA